MWEGLVTERGGTVLSDAGEANGAPEAPFACLLVADDELAAADRQDRRPRVVLVPAQERPGRGRGGGGGARSPISEADAAAALDAALAPQASWEADPDLGLELLVSGAPGVAEELLVPRFLYRRADRIYEYAAAMPKLLAGLTWLPGPRPGGAGGMPGGAGGAAE